MIVKNVSERECENGSEYAHFIGTDPTTYYFPIQQNQITIENLGSESIVVTLNGVTQTVTAGKGWTSAVDFVSFAIVSQSGQQKFSVRTLVNKQSSTTASVKDLVEPLFLSHRGGSNIYPENTMDAFRYSVACGVRIIEFDVYTLADGAMGIMHDTTVDRTTTGTGNVEDFDAYSFTRLTVDASVWLPGAKDTNPPLFEDLLREFGTSVIYVPESKDEKSAEKIAQTLLRYGLQDNAIIQSFNENDLAKAVPYGIPTMIVSNSIDPKQAKSMGFTYVGISITATDSYVTSLVNAGLKPVVYTIDYRDDWNTWKQKGCVGCFSNDPLWISGKSPVRKKDPYANKNFYHGHLAAGGNPRGTFIGTNRWGWSGNNMASYVLQAWGSPITNAAQTYTLQYNMTVEATNADTTRWGGCAFGSLTDYFFDNSSTRSNAYQLLVRQSGAIVLNKYVNGAITSLGTVTTTALALATVATIKIDVTPTTITVTRTDVGAPNTFTVTDSTFRGGYFYFSNVGLGVSFSAVTVTP